MVAKMVTKAVRVVDINDAEDLTQLVQDIDALRNPVIITHAGREVAVLSPLAPLQGSNDPLPRRKVTEEDRQAFLAAAGSWAGNVDFDAWERARAESRALPSRPPVDLSGPDEPE